MLRFPIGDLLDERACYAFLLHLLHPTGLACAHGHPLPPGQAPHDRHRAPILDYRCRECGSRLQPLHRDDLVQEPSSLFDHRAHPAGHRSGRADQPPGAGVGHRSGPPAGAPSCHPSAAGAAPFPPPCRCRTRSSKRMSCPRTPARRAFRTRTRSTHRAAGPTNGAATGRSPMIARRSRAWSGAAAGGSISGLPAQ